MRMILERLRLATALLFVALPAAAHHSSMRIAFVVDDEVWLAFTWEGPLGIGLDGTQLSIRNGMARA